MDTNAYLAKVYPSPPCWALVADVYASERAARLGEWFNLSGTVRAMAHAFRLALHGGGHGFRRLDSPVDYALVLMARRPGATPHHCGIFYGGRVLHATEAGVVYQDMASLADKWPALEFWSRA